MLLLDAVARGEWMDAIQRVRAALDACGFVLEERPFSGIQVSFHAEVSAGRLGELSGALQQNAVALRSASQAALDAAVPRASEGPTEVRLAVTLPEGDLDRRQIVPSVPG